MKKFAMFILMSGLVLPFMFLSVTLQAQMKVENNLDTVKQKVSTLNDKVAGVEERLATAEADLAKLTKIKLSGYIQAQWINYEASNVYPNNYFMIRRARIKFTYEPINGIVFVLQPDFQPGNITIKDVYVQANDPWLKTFSLFVGKFNRPDYEVEYSSSNREVPERSRVIRAIYPDERAIGAKLEIAPPTVPIKVQIAIFNGNDGIAINNPVYNYGSGKWDKNAVVGQNIDFDNFKDLMARVTYAFKFGKWGGLTIGTHGYYGQIKANSLDVLNSDYSYSKTLANVGKGVRKNWVGFEAQFYADVLGGLTLKGEYIFGVNSTPGYNGSASFVTQTSSINSTKDTLSLLTLTTKTINNAPAISRNFSGWYVYLIKNIGKRNQVAVRYDYYNPNTKLSADQIGTNKWDAKIPINIDPAQYTSFAGTNPVIATGIQNKTITTNKLVSGVDDIPYGTWTFSYSYYFTDNIKFMVAYEMPMNKKVGIVDAKGNGNVISSPFTVNNVTSTYDYSNQIKQNMLTLRMQVKF
ncbi:MAG: hypothetical protein NTY96_13180 [Bacteroidetes bacterium]|nr:hypothetical protein [Bacteroidota bacterium]